MYPFSIGVILDSFRTDIYTALDKAKALGAQGLQVYATHGEMSPEEMTPEKRKAFLQAVKDRGMVISALCGKRILDLAKDLETDIVTTHIGVVPEDKNHPRYQVMQDACRELAAYADSMDAHFAIETGPEKATVLCDFLDSLNSTGVAVNLDPANFVMVTGDDPVQAVYTLKKYIVHTHAKDGKRLYYRDPEALYGLVEEEMLADTSYIELPLGEGDVDFPNYLKALDEIGYKGFLTIEREVGDDPEGDIGKAVKFLENLIR